MATHVAHAMGKPYKEGGQTFRRCTYVRDELWPDNCDYTEKLLNGKWVPAVR